MSSGKQDMLHKCRCDTNATQRDKTKKQHDKHKTRNNKAKSAKTAAHHRPPPAKHRGPRPDFKKNDICSEPPGRAGHEEGHRRQTLDAVRRREGGRHIAGERGCKNILQAVQHATYNKPPKHDGYEERIPTATHHMAVDTEKTTSPDLSAGPACHTTSHCRDPQPEGRREALA
jgi:hypothetical protein